MYYFLLHAQAVQPLRQVLLGLDTYQMTSALAPHARFRCSTNIAGSFSLVTVWAYLADLKLMISFDTLMESIKTIRAQKQAPPEWFARDGQRLGEVFFHQPWENYQTLDHAVISMRSTNRRYATN